MATVAEVFTLAWNRHHEGAFAEAERLYRQIVGADFSNADAWCYLGVSCQAQSKLAEAEAALRQAVHVLPSHPSASNFLGAVLLQQGKPAEAVQSFRNGLRFEPDNKEVQNNLGIAYAQLGGVLAANGDLKRATNSLQQALRWRPTDAEVHYKLAVMLAKQKIFNDAIAHYKNALKLRPDFPEAHNNIGYALQRLDRIAEALTHWLAALRLRPNSPEVHNNLGNALQSEGRLEEAIDHYRQALLLQPSFAAAHNNLGNVLRNLGNLDEAIVHWQTASEVRPDYPEPLYNLGKELQKLGRLEEALAHYDQALGLNPDYADARWNRALIWLLQGDFERAWPEYEWRWTQPDFHRRSFKQPLWDGSPLHGRTILLYAEQGLGDTLQFIRYAPLLMQRGAKVVVECQPALLALLASTPGINHLVAQGSSLPFFDVQAPLLSLPGIFRTTMVTIPAKIPYLRPDADRVELWRKLLSKSQVDNACDNHGRLVRIGIAWQGSPTFRGDRERSIPLAQFAPLASVPGVELISLQKGEGTEQLADVASQFSVRDIGDNLDAIGGAFMDTAAIMMNLDLVISSDTAIAHLAGALGVAVWVALPLVPDWRWQLERADNPWYPSMRLFRQTRLGIWDDVFERLAEQIRQTIGDMFWPAQLVRQAQH